MICKTVLFTLAATAGFFVSTSAMAGAVVARLTSAGDLDPGFGDHGKVFNLDETGNNSVRFVPASGGTAFVGGRFPDSNGERQAIVGRFASDGTLDPSFGFFGVMSMDARDAIVVDIQSTLKPILALEKSIGRGSVRRLTRTGAPDPSFGSGGEFVIPGGFSVRDMIVTADDKITLVGDGDLGWRVVRLTADGQPDPTFSSDGMVEIISAPLLGAEGMAIDGDQIVIAGVIDKATTNFGVIRVTRTGTWDKTYGSNGIAVIDYSGTNYESGEDVACWPGVGCFVSGNANGAIALTLLTKTGQIDSTFGKKLVSFPGFSSAHAYGKLGITANQQVYVSGFATPSSGAGSIAVARYTFGGQLDRGFSSDGLVTIPFSGLDLRGGRVGLSIDHGTGNVWLCADGIPL